jgi:hypothetical protein
VQGGAVFGRVDRLTGEQPGAGSLDVGRPGEGEADLQVSQRPRLFRQLQLQAGGLDRQPFQPVGLSVEQADDPAATGLRGGFLQAAVRSDKRIP